MSKHRVIFESTAGLCLLIWALPATARPPEEEDGSILDLLASEQVVAPAFAGELDKSFSGNGKVTADFRSGSDVATGVVLQKDGKIVVVGSSFKNGPTEIAIARYLANGVLDSTFSGDGQVTTLCENGGGSFGVALQPNGRIIVVGNCGAAFFVARYLTGGTLDATFGNGGTVSTPFSPGFPSNISTSAGATAVAVQPDGKIVVAGGVQDGDGKSVGVARYLSNGALDASFGVGGKVRTGQGYEQVSAMSLQPDGKIVVAGGGFFGGLSEDFGLVRYLANGTPDTTFGRDGEVSTDLTSLWYSDEAIRALFIQPNDWIVAAGSSSYCVPISEDDCQQIINSVLVRYLPNGELDSTFGGDGIVIDDAPELTSANAVVVQVDRKILVAGTDSAHFTLARYSSAGSRDSTFGTWDSTLGERTGRITTSFGGLVENANAVVIGKTSGKIVVAGSTDPTNTASAADFAVSRYHAFTCRGFAATLVGTPENDILRGTVGDDVIVGLGGDDRIFGLNGDDVLCGGSGSDTLFGGGGLDVCDGGSNPSTGEDRVHGCEIIHNVP